MAITLKSLKPSPSAREPQTLAEHLKARRLELGLRQRDVADRLGVGANTVLNWEYGTVPPEPYWPSIIEFLGYFPGPFPKSLGERLFARRRILGLSRKRAAKKIGIDAGTLARWEADDWMPMARSRELIHKFLRCP